MTSHNGFIPMTADQLPPAPGVIMVCCPEGLNTKTARVIVLVQAENVLEKVKECAVSWATECTSGYLEYLVAQVSDPTSSADLLENATKQTPPGSVITKP